MMSFHASRGWNPYIQVICLNVETPWVASSRTWQSSQPSQIHSFRGEVYQQRVAMILCTHGYVSQALWMIQDVHVLLHMRSKPLHSVSERVVNCTRRAGCLPAPPRAGMIISAVKIGAGG
jgi:hypothetical protein